MLRPRDLEPYGIPREHLRRLYEKGQLDRPSRGVYVLADSSPNEREGLIQACKRVPKGVVCLISALQFHSLTTQHPFEVWLALPHKAWQPTDGYPPLRIVRFSGDALNYGIKEHAIRGVAVRVFTPAKTVADCFKFRSKIGLEVAREALRDCWKQKKATMDELWEAAKVCRMTNVMRPYMEAIA